jgi:hypothetical protein
MKENMSVPPLGGSSRRSRGSRSRRRSRLGQENDLAALLIEAAAISEPIGAQLNRSDRYAHARVPDQ